MTRRPAIGPRRRTQLRIAAAVCSLAGLGAIIAHVFGLLSMPYFLSFVGVPSLLLLMVMAVFARLADERIFLNALWVGIVGGLCGTLIYDGVRYTLYHGGVFNYDGFKAIYLFGHWMTGQDVGSPGAALGGWLYHFWNGLSFGVFYVLAFGNRRFFWGIGYGVVMELAMLGLFPFFLTIDEPVDFVALSLIGHMFYGAALGAVAERYARRWPTSRTENSQGEIAP